MKCFGYEGGHGLFMAKGLKEDKTIVETSKTKILCMLYITIRHSFMPAIPMYNQTSSLHNTCIYGLLIYTSALSLVSQSL